jgi:type II secretory ATPase GspE/PulE/Tfp pilus assembly ATPase PilB-like protein
MGQPIKKHVEKNEQETFIQELKRHVNESRKIPARKEIGSLETASIKNLVDGLIAFAYQSTASDIHIDPIEDGTIVRYRIDGILHDVLLLDSETHFKVITRIKVLSELRTDEHYAPQDGRFRLVVHETPIDLRVSISPTFYGENTVLRLLIGENDALALEDLGFSDSDLERIKRNIAKSYGMIIATGPTGSGKTTTLYALLDILNSRERSIITIEDPIEYTVPGVTQIQINPRTDLTFAKGLRTIVRQDPNIIMVGEIRDEETASISINAAMTGHLLLSTLHTNSASVTLPRLLDMGIEPFLIASTVNLAIGQRLVRRLCHECAVKKPISDIERETLSHFISKEELAKITNSYVPQGCPACSQSGYVGRVGIYEVMELSEQIKRLIMKRENASEIQKVAVEEGMTLMISDGLMKASKGLTSLSEVVRIIQE